MKSVLARVKHADFSMAVFVRFGIKVMLSPQQLRRENLSKKKTIRIYSAKHRRYALVIIAWNSNFRRKKTHSLSNVRTKTKRFNFTYSFCFNAQQHFHCFNLKFYVYGSSYRWTVFAEHVISHMCATKSKHYADKLAFMCVFFCVRTSIKFANVYI